MPVYCCWSLPHPVRHLGKYSGHLPVATSPHRIGRMFVGDLAEPYCTRIGYAVVIQNTIMRNAGHLRAVEPRRWRAKRRRTRALAARELAQSAAARRRRRSSSRGAAAPLAHLGAAAHRPVSDLSCNVRREGGQSLVIGGSSLVMLEGGGRVIPCNRRAIPCNIRRGGEGHPL